MQSNCTALSAVKWSLFFLLSQSVVAQNTIPAMPEAVSNNAVAKVTTEQGNFLISFMGIGSGKKIEDIHNKVWSHRLGDKTWEARNAVPFSTPLPGRLASVAVGIRDKAYIFGGYTVAEDHSEKSSPDNFSYDILRDRYQPIAPMPVSVDDAVALAYQQRYIYIISGWHHDGNVNLVQVYDTQTNIWQQASPFLGTPVFGHAGGISGNQIVICDGVSVRPRVQQRRTFLAETACYSGLISSDKTTKIDWRKIPHPTGKARYRMAATALNNHSEKNILFAGGSDNPYNYDGMGYNGEASYPNNELWLYNLTQRKWRVFPDGPNTMDHRGLVVIDNNSVVILGGMNAQQAISNQVSIIRTSRFKR
jgi:N-acetylneuraminic acid mutarotase